MKLIYEALVKLQEDIKNPPKDSTANITANRQYRYADLATVIDTNKAALRKYGLGFIHRQTFKDGVFCLETWLVHTSGEKIESFFPIDPNLKDQEKGSSITYGRRYNICCLLNIAGDEDTDRQEEKQPPAKAPTNYSNKASPAQAALLLKKAQLKKLTEAELKHMLITNFKVSNVADVPRAQVNDAIAMLDAYEVTPF